MSRFLLWAVGLGLAIALAGQLLIRPLVGPDLALRAGRFLTFFVVGYLVQLLIPAFGKVPGISTKARVGNALLSALIAELLMIALEGLRPVAGDPAALPPNRVVQELVSRYAPGVALGEPFSPVESRQFRLEPAPYVGWQDTAYAGPDGVLGLRVQVEADFPDESTRPPRGARVLGITLGLPSEAVRQRVQDRLSEALGKPAVYCRPNPPESRAQLSYWSKGALIVESRAVPPRAELAGSMSTLFLGVVRSPSPASTDSGPCGDVAP